MLTPPTTIQDVQECLEAYLAGEAVPQVLLSEALRQVQFFLESQDLPLATKARLQKLELTVLDTYHPPLTEEDTRLILTFVHRTREGLAVPVLVKCVEATIDLISEVAKVTDLTFIPSYDLAALQSGGLNVAIRCLSLDYYQPNLDAQKAPTYLSLIERVGELFQALASADLATKESLQQLLSAKARRSINQLVRLLRSEEETSDLQALRLTIAQGHLRIPCAELLSHNWEKFYFPEAPEWQEITLEATLIRREQDLDERKNSVHLQAHDGVVYLCRKFNDRLDQEHLSQLTLGATVRLRLKVRYTYDDALAPRRAEGRVLQVEYPLRQIQQISLWD